MGTGLVSIVLPTRNRAELLKRAVASVLSQRYPHWELTIINDGSTDGTGQWLSGLDDTRIRVVHREQGLGAASARNVGIGLAQGEFVAFLDDDDYWLETKLEAQVAALQSSGGDWSLSGFRRLRNGTEYHVGGPRHPCHIDFSGGVGERGHDWSMIATPGWLVRRELLQRCGGFDERIRSYDDWELAIRFTRAGVVPLILPGPLWVQDHFIGGGLVRARRARARDLRIIMDKHGALWQDRPDVLARHWYLIGRTESLFDPAPAGRAELWRSLRHRPLRPLSWFALVASHIGPRWNERLTGWSHRLRSALR